MTPRAGWRFTLTDTDPWVGSVDAAPVEMSERRFFAAAVPELAPRRGRGPSPGHVVVGHVTAPGRNQQPGGPVGRAKGLLDALHDNRCHGPFYRDLGVQPPLADDDPAHVSVLAVEVGAGDPRTEYLIGTGLRVDGQLLAAVPIERAAPNDIAGTPGEATRIDAARRQYRAAVSEAFGLQIGLAAACPGAVVVRHWPQRDPDNTWRTWTTAICGAPRGGNDHWAAGAPLNGWRPTAVASVADTSINTPVVYELWT
jgi:hypothetical protein